MYKAILALFSFFPVFFLSVFDGDEVSITLNAPDQIELNQEVQVDLIFNKGSNVLGFGKFEARFDKNVEIEPIETQSGTFTYSDGVMKILWLSLPEEGQFVLSYKLIAREGTPSDLSIGGKFSYLIDNEKKSSAIMPKIVKVGSGAAAEEIVVVPAKANATRSLRQTSENQYVVDIVIEKQGIEGFSKIEEFVPKGAVVSDVFSENAAFSYLRGKVKYVWLGTPMDGSLKVSYELNLAEATSQDVSSIRGEYSFLEDNETRKVDIMSSGELVLAEETAPKLPEDLLIGGVKLQVREATVEEKEELASAPVQDKVIEETPKKETAEVVQKEEVVEEESVEEITQGVKIEEGLLSKLDMKIDEGMMVRPEESIEEEMQTTAAANTMSTSVPSPQKGIFYRVQIAAGKNLVNAAYFKSRHSYTDDFIIENHQGWVKYTMGKFDMYRSARDQRNQINSAGHNFDGPFVTAYNAGDRITVQEALMITKQKWFR